MSDARLTSVFELVVSRSIKRYGAMKGARIGGTQAAFIIEWATYCRDTGDDPGSVERYVVWANVSPRTGYYRLDLFRSLFPEHSFPSELPLVAPVKGVRGLPGTAALDAVHA